MPVVNLDRLLGQFRLLSSMLIARYSAQEITAARLMKEGLESRGRLGSLFAQIPK